MTSPAADMPSTTPITLAAEALGAEPLDVPALEGTEQVSAPFRFVAHVVVEDPRRLVDRLVGLPAVLTLHASGGDAQRRIHGVVERATAGQTLSGAIPGRDALVEVTLVPRMALLGHRTLSRVFQDRTVPQVIAEVLGEHRVRHRLALSRTYSSREYCVQYNETDLAFVERLAAEEGVHYHFADEGDDTAAVFCDTPSLLARAPGAGELFHRAFGDEVDDPGRPLREDQLASLAVTRRVAPTSALLRDYDLERPQLEIRGHSTPLAAPIEHERMSVPDRPTPALSYYEHRGDYERTDTDAVKATVVLEQLRSDVETAHAITGCRTLAPGHTLAIKDHPIAALNELVIVTRVAHSHARSRHAAEITAIPARLPYRPPRPSRRVVQALETGTVTGPAGKEIHTDAHGRVRVRFHWDLRPEHVERASCFVRVITPWAGTGWGMMAVPRIGMEVAVSFLGGDPDRPVVLGALPNATHPPPFSLPAATRSGIRTSSTPDGRGHNELSFEDSAGAEEMFLRAERDLREQVQHDRVTSVGNDRRTTITNGDYTEIEGIKVTRVRGDEIRSIRGDLTTSVDGGATVTVSGAGKAFGEGDLAIGAAGSVSVDAEGTARIAAAGSIALRVDNPDGRGEVTIDVDGSARTQAAREVLIRGEERVRLLSGDTEILLTPEGVTIRAKQIRLEATESLVLSGKGPTLTLGEEAEVVAKKVRVYSEKAAVELDSDARIWGEAVKLQPPKSPPPEKDEQTGEPKTKPVSLRFLDDQHEPYSECTYQLVAGGQRFRGELGEDGALAIEVPEDADTADVTVWIDSFPEGRRRRYSFRLGALPPAREPRGAKHRLKSLGYFNGVVDDVLTPELTRAIVWFQKDYELEATGEMDDATSAELEKLHGQ